MRTKLRTNLGASVLCFGLVLPCFGGDLPLGSLFFAENSKSGAECTKDPGMYLQLKSETDVAPNEAVWLLSRSGDLVEAKVAKICHGSDSGYHARILGDRLPKPTSVFDDFNDYVFMKKIQKPAKFALGAIKPIDSKRREVLKAWAKKNVLHKSFVHHEDYFELSVGSKHIGLARYVFGPADRGDRQGRSDFWDLDKGEPRHLFDSGWLVPLAVMDWAGESKVQLIYFSSGNGSAFAGVGEVTADGLESLGAFQDWVH